MLKKETMILSSAAIAWALMLGACAHKSSNVAVPVPTPQMAKASGKSLDTLGKGYSLFQVHCAQCHELKMPKDMRVEEWHAIVPGMAWNAGLKKEDEQAVMSYLVAATQQINPSD